MLNRRCLPRVYTLYRKKGVRDSFCDHALQSCPLATEGPIEIKGVTIAENTLVRSTDNTTSPVAAGPNATGVVFSDNKIVPN